VIAEQGGGGYGRGRARALRYGRASDEGIHVYGTLPPADGDFAMVIIPWDQAADVSHRILQLARNHGDVR
jgi:hypothetical protein